MSCEARDTDRERGSTSKVLVELEDERNKVSEDSAPSVPCAFSHMRVSCVMEYFSCRDRGMSVGPRKMCVCVHAS